MTTAPLLGLDRPRHQLEQAFRQERMPHAWLLSGIKGIGKASLVQECASAFLLSSPDLLAASSHPDFRHVAPEEGKAGITVEQIRDLVGFARSTPSLGGWRVILIDSADDLNLNAANSLLKILEEPGGRTLLFLISHRRGQLLPTIRSRCVLLRIKSPSRADLETILARHDVRLTPALYATAQGSPGRALEYATGAHTGVLEDAQTLRENVGTLPLTAKLQFADAVASAVKQNPALWPALGSVWLSWAARQLKQAAVHRTPLPLMRPRWQAYSRLEALLRDIPAQHLDARTGVLECYRCLERVEV
jgi:DNA polymerase III subunit delta'